MYRAPLRRPAVPSAPVEQTYILVLRPPWLWNVYARGARKENE